MTIIANPLQPIIITFFSDAPDGLRQISSEIWSGRCLMFSRRHVATVLRSEGIQGLDVSGIYILVGAERIETSEIGSYVVPQIYIGQGRSVRDRIESHDARKNFWSTAVIFYRDPPLNAAHLDGLEYSLINEARSARALALDNKQIPNKPYADSSMVGFIEDFATRMKSTMKALGHDFFSKEKSPEVLVPNEDAAAAGVRPIPDDQKMIIPPNLERIINDFRELCCRLPSAELYVTGSDVRGKVSAGNQSRVFMLINLNRHSIRIGSHYLETFSMNEQDGINPLIAQKIEDAHLRAKAELARK